MSLRAYELLKHLPVEIQYQELKALEESVSVAYRRYRKNLISLARGRGLCFGLSLIMARAIVHPGINQWLESKLQLNRIAGISVSTASNKPKQADKIAAALVDYTRKHNWEVRTA